MVLESLGIGFPWSWSNPHARGLTSGSSFDKKRSRRKHSTRSRADKAESANGRAQHGTEPNGSIEGYYPGLVNVSGTYCFMNSTIQAMASLSYLQPHIDAIHAKAEALDVPTPVIDALRDLLLALNTPKDAPYPIRPTALISALSNHSPKHHSVTLFSSREHQDAQELFQLLSECIKAESVAVDKEGYRDRGLGGIGPPVDGWRKEIGKSPFDGLTANRRSCVECGYTEAVMHFAFDNWQLAVPAMMASCQLEQCLEDYTRLEVLTDCICRKCSMLATHERLLQDAAKPSETDANASSSKRKKAKEAKRLEARVKAALEQGRIEEDIKGVKMVKVISKASTKQAMIARPPLVLVLHINRSVHYGQYAAKNSIRLVFPEVLDLTPFTTSGNLSTVPSVPMSTPPPRSATPTPATYSLTRTGYRLSAVVCHYGHHSFGHYVCFRRKPRSVPLEVDKEKAIADDDDQDKYREKRRSRDRDRGWDREWLRVSDDSVRECTLNDVLAEGSGAFMLYYERVVSPSRQLSPRSSEETLRPDMKCGNGSSVSLASTSGSVVVVEGPEQRKARTRLGRVVRSVAPGRDRSASLGPLGAETGARGNGSTASLNGSAGGKQRAADSSRLLNGSAVELPEDLGVPGQDDDRSPTPPASPHFFQPPSQPIEAPRPKHPPATPTVAWT